MRRREFISLLGGAAAAWPVAARRSKASGCGGSVCSWASADDDPEGRPVSRPSCRGLQELGWTVGRNLRIDYRWPAGDADRFRRYAAELVALEPDVILATNGPAVAACNRRTQSVPIVFLAVVDPVGGGFVESLARPAATSPVLSVRIWFGREMVGAAQGDRAEFDASGGASECRQLTAGIGQFAVIQAVAPSSRWK